MDEGGEALSPLLASKGLLVQGGSFQTAGGLAAAATAVPGTGSVGGTPQPFAAGAAAPGAGAADFAQPVANGTAKPEGAQQEQAAAVAAAGASSPGFASPGEWHSTLAVDLAPPFHSLNGTNAAREAEQPQPSASGQPSSLPPPGMVAAALAAAEQQQAALNGSSSLQTPAPAVPAELGELYYALQQQVILAG